MIKAQLKILIYSTVFFCTSFSNSQDFKGYVEYKITVQKTDSTFTDDDFLKGFGSNSIFYYEDGSYFQSYDNSMMEFVYLDSKLKELGLKYINNDTLYLFDATKAGNMKLIKTEKSSSTKEILGYKCLRIHFYAKNIVDSYNLLYSFYYSDEMKINGEKFKGMKFELLDEIYGNLNSIPLSIEMNYPIFSVQSTAVKIVEDYKFSVIELIENNCKELIVKRIN